MNKCTLIGRTARDIELRYTTGQNPLAIAKFTLAVNRRGKDKGADFISCVAFGKTAEILDRYVQKGHRLGVGGHIQTGSYEKDGHKVYTTDVIVEEFDFLENKQTEQQTEPQDEMPYGFYQSDDDMPF